ncbi:MAG TPA: nuclear transport factor 2 family protein [Leptospiraceae bacterium]|nr:nuclear transport factor 2 family protein [Leptospiraceae bacterium]HMW06216.1 nuclear transport factor 2 family protein [Leptospiraceae bacterium]HMX34291.1 nuclear transport factor 2 family protein [Leptospiraceae bacterium]HMY31678.1 nuclear transport factor 2 family protein [Leptospiraceae bacterium]HMZ65655.1 nuclear transport factor 2 family protein [Leptospiraceae bacterium]
METIEEKDLKSSLESDFLSLMGQIDKQNVSYVEEALHKDYHDSVWIKGASGVFSSTKDDYLGYLSKGKIGGMDRKVEIRNLEILDQFGIIRSKLESNVMKFDGGFTFFLENNQWKLIKVVMVAEKK